MAPPLYFLPGRRRAELLDARDLLRRDLLAAHALDRVLADCTRKDHVAVCELAGPGPGGRTGTVLCALAVGAKDPPRRIGYYPAEQAWSHAAGEEATLWLGLSHTEPVAAEDLARRTTHGGYLVNLSDALRILAPIVRRPDGSTSLPSDLEIDAAGDVAQSVQAAYRGLWQATAVACEWILDEKGFEAESFSLRAAVGLALDCLSVNYRYDARLQNQLHWLDSTNWSLVLMAAVDAIGAARIAEAQKKSGPSDGPPASTT